MDSAAEMAVAANGRSWSPRMPSCTAALALRNGDLPAALANFDEAERLLTGSGPAIRRWRSPGAGPTTAGLPQDALVEADSATETPDEVRGQ